MRFTTFILLFIISICSSTQNDKRYDITVINEKGNIEFYITPKNEFPTITSSHNIKYKQYYIKWKNPKNNVPYNFKVFNDYFHTNPDGSELTNAVIDIGFFGFDQDAGYISKPNTFPDGGEAGVLSLLEVILKLNYESTDEYIISIPSDEFSKIDKLFDTQITYNSRVFFLIVNKDVIHELPPELLEVDYQQYDVQSEEITNSGISPLVVVDEPKEPVQNEIAEPTTNTTDLVKIDIIPSFFSPDEKRIETSPELLFLAYEFLQQIGFFIGDTEISYNGTDYISISQENMPQLNDLKLGDFRRPIYFQTVEQEYLGQQQGLSIDFTLLDYIPARSYVLIVNKTKNDSKAEAATDWQIKNYKVEVWFNNKLIKTKNSGASERCEIEGLLEYPDIKYSLKVFHPDYDNLMRKADSDSTFKEIIIQASDYGSDKENLVLLSPKSETFEVVFEKQADGSISSLIPKNFSINIPNNDFKNGVYLYDPANDPYHIIKNFSDLWSLSSGSKIEIHKHKKRAEVLVSRRLIDGEITINFNGKLPGGELIFELQGYSKNEKISKGKIREKDLENGSITLSIKKLPTKIMKEDGMSITIHEPFGYDIYQSQETWEDWKNERITIPITDFTTDLTIRKLPTYEFFYLDISDIYDLGSISGLIDTKIIQPKAEYLLYLSNSDQPVVANSENPEELNNLLNMILMLRPEPPFLNDEAQTIKSYTDGLIFNENRREVNFSFLFSEAFMSYSALAFIEACIPSQSIPINAITIYINSDKEMPASVIKKLEATYKTKVTVINIKK